MDKIAAQNIVEETFNYPFNEDKFSKFSINLFNNISGANQSPWLKNLELPGTIKDSVIEYKIFGTTKYESGSKLTVAIAKLKSRNVVEKSRHVQRNFAKYLIDKNNVDACLVAFFSDKYDDWRFSFVSVDYNRELTNKGKIKIKSSDYTIVYYRKTSLFS